MIRLEDLYIVNYCHPNCSPLKNIMRLPKEEAFALAGRLAAANRETTAFYRFADFANYYPRRLHADRWLYQAFRSLGGSPKTEHPLSFVLQGNDYLEQWFDRGKVTKIPLIGIPSESVSFTYGDSTAVLQRGAHLKIVNKEQLLESICEFDGTLEGFLDEITKRHHYIEVQLWDDSCCASAQTAGSAFSATGKA
jgi:hypothetical protein